MLSAAKEEMALSTLPPPGVLFPLVAFEGVGENSRQGFGRTHHTLHQGFEGVNSTTALGIEPVWLVNGVRSRCTGKERDTESNLDFFGARYMSSGMGRFISADNPKFSEKSDPQTWNLYSYVSNNPLSRIDPTGNNWFNIDGKWEWHKGNKYTYTDAQGKSHTVKSNYTHLLVIQKTGHLNQQGGAEVKITLWGNSDPSKSKLIAQGTGFTGGPGISPVPNGNFEINLNNRGGLNTNRIIAVAAGLVLAPFHDGIQQVSDNITYRGQDGYNAQLEWGQLRANLSKGPGQGTPYYLHGKGLYFTEGRSYTAGCVCEPHQGVLRVIFNLDPSGVGEGNKNGRIAVSVNKGN
jgi:RHS repeat-associated protein